MEKEMWSFWNNYRGYFAEDKYLIALGYHYLEMLEAIDAESEILQTDIKESLAAKLTKEELGAIELLMEEDFKIEDIKSLFIESFSKIDYSRKGEETNSNESIMNLASRFFDFEEQEFADFCSGNGGMLSQALQNGASTVTGIEVEKLVYQLSILRLWIEHGVLLTDQIIKADVFEYFENHPEKKYKQIFSEFPLSLCRTNDYVFEGIKINRISDWGFISLVMNQLQEGGQAVVISSPSIEYRKPDEEIREHFIREGYIEEVIALPGGILTGTGIPPYMLILSHNNESIRFTDATGVYSTVGRIRLLRDEDIDQIVNLKDIKAVIPNEKVLEASRLSPQFYLLPEVAGGTPLKELADILNSRPVLKKEIDEYSASENTGIELIRLSHVHENKIYDGDFINDEISKLVELENLDLIVTRTGSKINVALYQSEEDMRTFIDENFFVIRMKNKKVDPYYLFAYMQSEMGQKYLSSVYSGTVIQRINKADLNRLNIPLVSKSDQRKISHKTQDFIDKINKLELKLDVLEDERIETINSWFKEN